MLGSVHRPRVWGYLGFAVCMWPWAVLWGFRGLGFIASNPNAFFPAQITALIIKVIQDIAKRNFSSDSNQICLGPIA